MQSIQIDDELFNIIVKNSKPLEDASCVLRRMLRFTRNETSEDRKDVKSIATAPPSRSNLESHAEECLGDPRLRGHREVLGRFKFMLAWLHKKHGEEAFSRITQVEGRKRRYFAKSPDGLKESGTSVDAQEIPGSGWWMVANNDTPKKKRMLEDVLRVFGYTAPDIKRFVSALEGESVEFQQSREIATLLEEPWPQVP